MTLALVFIYFPPGFRGNQKSLEAGVILFEFR